MLTCKTNIYPGTLTGQYLILHIQKIGTRPEECEVAAGVNSLLWYRMKVNESRGHTFDDVDLQLAICCDES